MMPAAFTGMVPSAFRPSDDACQLPFHIPANAFFSMELAKLASATSALPIALLQEAALLSGEITQAIETYGKIHHGKGFVYAYEVDGYGSVVFLDDANLPSLISLPLTGYVNVNDRTYQTTRALLLSKKSNPSYFEGAISGVGSPHTGQGRVWPLALMSQYLTASDPTEKHILLRHLIAIGEMNGLFPESVNVTEISDLTRADFGWANSFFSCVILAFLNIT